MTLFTSIQGWIEPFQEETGLPSKVQLLGIINGGFLGDDDSSPATSATRDVTQGAGTFFITYFCFGDTFFSVVLLSLRVLCCTSIGDHSKFMSLVEQHNVQ